MAINPFSVLSSGAQANPLGAAAGVAGLGLEAYGAITGAMAGRDFTKASEQYASTVNPLYAAKTQQDITIAQREQDIQAKNQQFMELTNQRQQLQNLRNAQVARAQAVANATNQGANVSGASALGGAFGQIGGEEATNALGLSQGLQIGRDIFAANTAISGARITQFGIENQIQAATTQFDTARNKYQAASQTAAGFEKLGGSLMGAVNPLGIFKTS